MLIQHLTRCENFHSKTDELWKRWLEDSLVMKTLVQKLFPIPVFFLRLILFEEALNCHLWGFHRVFLQKKIFKSEFCNRIWFFKSTILHGNLRLCKNVDSTSDTLWKFSFKNWRVVKELVDENTRINFLIQKLFANPDFCSD